MVKYMCDENYKTLMKESEEDISKWKGILSSWTGRIRFVTLPILAQPKLYTFKTIPIKIPKSFFREVDKNSKMYMESWKIMDWQRTLEEKSKAEGLILPNFKLYYKDMVTI